MSHLYHPPADASDEEMRAAYLRNRFLDLSDHPPETAPRDCVLRIALPGGLVQLMAIDDDGEAGPCLVLPVEHASPSDVEWLHARCRQIRPPRATELRLIG